LIGIISFSHPDTHDGLHFQTPLRERRDIDVAVVDDPDAETVPD
jgi:hypothetical protein